MPTKKLENLLNPLENGGLADLVRRARDMGALTEALAKALPPGEAENLVAANIRDGGELVVICSSPAWASRLRFEEQALLDAARRHGVDAESLTVRVGHAE